MYGPIIPYFKLVFLSSNYRLLHTAFFFFLSGASYIHIQVKEKQKRRSTFQLLSNSISSPSPSSLSLFFPCPVCFNQGAFLAFQASVVLKVNLHACHSPTELILVSVNGHGYLSIAQSACMSG